MNVRRAILQRLEASQATLDQLLELDYLDRLITRTLKRMVRHERITERDGVYAIFERLVVVEAPVVVVESVVVVEPVVVEEPVTPAPKPSPFTPAPLEVVEKSFALEEVKNDSMALLDNTVKYIVALLPTLGLAEIGALKDAELAGKARKSLITAMNKLEG